MKKDCQLLHLKFQPYYDKFICGSVSNSFQCFIAKWDLEITHCKAIIWVARRKLTEKVAQKKETITIWDMRVKVTKRVETKIEKAKRDLDWAKTVELKKKNIKIATHKKL